MFNKFMAVGAAAATLVGAAGAAQAGKDLDAVKARGQLICGVTTGVAGFSLADSQGKWTGLDVDLCRAVSAAIFGESEKVKYVPTTAQQRFTALQSGEVDLLARTTTWTLTRDTALGFEFTGVNYYDGQGFMVNKKLGVKSAKELDGATVCVSPGTTTELNLADYFRANKMQFRPTRSAPPSSPAAATSTRQTPRVSMPPARPTHPSPMTTSSCPRSSPRSRSVRSYARATTSSPTSCAGHSMPCSRPRSTASTRRTSTRC
jgi:ABC-type amino acid transport substrate-binding protein